MSIYERIAEKSEALFKEAVETRRSLHRWPEAGFKEFKTSAFVESYLKGLGLDEVRTQVAGTGVVATLRGALAGPTLALRADMDGLPITEKTGLPFKSEHEGWMHGCGHDAHTAGLLLTAKLLSSLKSELPGSVKFIFQPAEEGPGGALPMIEQGALDGVDAIVGGHVWGALSCGQVALKAGPMFAAPDEFRITINGVGGHAAVPDTAIDTIPIAANIVSALQTIVSRRLAPGTPCVVAVGTINAGYRFNVIPDRAYITGTVRTFDPEVQDMVRNAIREMSTGIASSMGANADVEYICYYPTLSNDATVTRSMRMLAAKVLGSEQVIEAKPLMIGEDFSYFLNKIPGTFILIGSANESAEFKNDVHHPCFNINERAMVSMMKLYASVPFWFSKEGYPF